MFSHTTQLRDIFCLYILWCHVIYYSIDAEKSVIYLLISNQHCNICFFRLSVTWRLSVTCVCYTPFPLVILGHASTSTPTSKHHIFCEFLLTIVIFMYVIHWKKCRGPFAEYLLACHHPPRAAPCIMTTYCNVFTLSPELTYLFNNHDSVVQQLTP